MPNVGLLLLFVVHYGCILNSLSIYKSGSVEMHEMAELTPLIHILAELTIASQARFILP